ncbi:MAG: N-formylglutamate amidohydrolase [Planctomycetota bacterium]|jgi:predicted N-formylglutamate amidohydrolase
MSARSRPWHVVITCEHAGNDVPPELTALFAPHRALLRTHRGYDPGAAPVAMRLAAALHAPLLLGRYSRLVVDLNRSATNRDVFSDITRGLPREQRKSLIERWHAPHRDAVVSHVGRAVASGERVLHMGVHTFARSIGNGVRQLDLGLLYDPDRRPERAIGAAWKRSIGLIRRDLRTRLNQPYKGTSDGLVVLLRRRFGEHAYAGIEIEIAQDRMKSAAAHAGFAELLARTLPCSSG